MIGEMLLISASLLGRGAEGKIEVPAELAPSLISESMTLHKEEIVEAHNEFYDEQWSCPDKIDCLPLIENDKTVAFRAKVGVHGFDFDLDGNLIEDSVSFNGVVGSSEFSGLNRLKTTEKLNSFAVKECITPIPSLVSMFPSFDFGDWNVVSFDQTGNDCAVVALMNLLYTYKLSGKGDLVGNASADSVYNSIANAVKYNPSSGTDLDNFASGFNSWLPSSWRLERGKDEPNVPHIVIYESNVAGEPAHAALKIGRVSFRPELILARAYRDLVVSYHCNFLGDTPTDTAKNLESCFYTVGTSFRKASYTLVKV